MKKILISTHSLRIGGIEKALLNLIYALLSTKQYEVTLCLEKKEGEYLEMLPEAVKVITYEVSNLGIGAIRKTINMNKQLAFKKEYENKFDASICYATYSNPCSFVARTASQNSILWVHNDYLEFYGGDVIQYKRFYNELKVEEYKKIVFVSDKDRKVFGALMPHLSPRLVRCNNLLDFNDIRRKAMEPQNELVRGNVPTFITVCRMDENQKKISRIIEATRRLCQEGYKFRVALLGDGPDIEQYKESSQNLPNIHFFGSKLNPYNYMRQANALLMSSQYEGYPVVWLEALTLGLPIVTTDVSDAKSDIEGKYGIVGENSDTGLLVAMRTFLQQGFRMQPFSPEAYNQNVLNTLAALMNSNENEKKAETLSDL